MTIANRNPETGVRTKHKVSILVRWEKIQKLLDSPDERARKYKEELFGSSSIDEFPDEYNQISIMKKAGSWVDIDKYNQLPIHTKAKLIAHSYLEGIIEIITRHDSLQKQKAKDLENRSAKNAQN